ncbi:MAG: SPOR domain-containing protein [Steroidobacteraceae bacterium]
MDEALKARLIGAAVLVAIAVVLVPELLSGRHVAQAAADAPVDKGLRKFTITTGSGNGSPETTFHAQLPADAGVAPATAPAATLADNQPASVAAAAGSTPASKTGPAAATTTSAPATSPTPGTTAAAGSSHPATPVAAPAASAPPPSAAPTGVAATPVNRPPPAPPAPARGAWAVQVGAFGSTQAADKIVQDLRSAGFHAYVSPVQRSGKTLFRVRVGPEPERARADALATTLKGRGLPATVVAND